MGVAFATGAGEIAQSAHAGAGPGEESNKRSFRIPAGPLGPALSRFATAAGARLSFDPALIEGKTTRGLRGDFTREEGLAALLAGTGLEWAPGPGGTYTVRPAAPAQAIPEGPVPTGEQPVELDPITVIAQPLDQGFKANMQESATKMPLSIRETPQSISVITQDSLDARQVQDLGQALETAAGVNQFSGTGPFAGKSPFGFDNVTIRGIALDGYFDTREDGFINPTFFSQPDVAIYERIEAVKGPSSVLYGRGSAGGFVNRVRKKPLPEFHAEIAPSIGSFDRYRLDADVTGPLFRSDTVRGRIVTAYEDASAFVDGVESDRLLFAPGLEFDLTDSTRLLVQGTYQKDNFIPNPGFPLVQDGDMFRAPNIRRSLFVGLPNRDENEWEVLTGTAQLEQQLGDKWLATLRLNRSSQDSPIETDSYAYGISPAGNVGLYSSAFTFDTDVWSGEIRLEGNIDLFGRPANVAFGVDHNDLEQARNDFFTALGTANLYAENFADFPTVPPTTLSRDSIVDAKGTGVYAQIQFRPFERLSVLLGARYDRADSAYIDNLADMTSEREDDAFTERVGLTFDINDKISVYGLFAESFFPSQFNTGADGKLLEPQEGVIYEMGVKTEWLDGKLGINAAIFRIERDKVPIPDPTNGPGEFDSISAGLQRSDGFELEINGEPLPGWNLSFGGVLLDSEFIERDDPFFGSIPAGAGDWQAGLFTSYELQGGPLKGWGAGVGLFAIDDRGVSSFIPGATLEGYERVDLSAFYNGFEPLTVALQVRNVFDEIYVEGADRTSAYAQFGSPTAVLLSVRYDFGD
ncbi:MAG: TonB-dependent siderophore receptor [Gammaproteobacteria bacterium]